MKFGYVAAAALLVCAGAVSADEKSGSVWESRKSAWENLAPGQKDEVFRFAEDYKKYLSVSRTAETSTREVMRLAKAAGYSEFTKDDQVKPGARLYVNGRDRAIILIVLAEQRGARLRLTGSGLCGSAAHPAFGGKNKRRPLAAGFIRERL